MKTRLHDLINGLRRGANTESEVLAEIKARPESAKKKDTSDSLLYPLHMACHHNLPTSIILELIGACPSVVQVQDKQGCYPLHWAVNAVGSVEVIRSLVRAYPDAARQRDNYGKLPMHYVNEGRNLSAEAFEELRRAYPAAVRHRDAHGNVPLNASVIDGGYSHAPAEVLEALEEANPEAKSEKRNVSNLPRMFQTLGRRVSLSQVMFDEARSDVPEDSDDGISPEDYIRELESR